jgi:glycosyltransferase involved in cell wall biosynthesis
MHFFSLIIPVYNRPYEVFELLESLSRSTNKNFEVIIIEDGSTVKCDTIVTDYSHALNIKYEYQNNTGPGPARNRGAKAAKGEYLIFLDSDVIVPENYLEIVVKHLLNYPVDCFGGPDKAHDSFTSVQKAINYSMTSNLTTGGIRGSKEGLDRFYPRSFNLGIKATVFNDVNGFSKMRFGEDLDLSMRIIEKEYQTALIPDAFVYHKRRNNFNSFFKQVYNSGIARINLEMRHRHTLKLVHALPMVFTFYIAISLILTFIHPIFAAFLVAPAVLFFLDALRVTAEIKTSAYSILAAYTQLTGYGLGFAKAFLMRIILGRDEFYSFKKTFYK